MPKGKKKGESFTACLRRAVRVTCARRSVVSSFVIGHMLRWFGEMNQYLSKVVKS